MSKECAFDGILRLGSALNIHLSNQLRVVLHVAYEVGYCNSIYIRVIKIIDQVSHSSNFLIYLADEAEDNIYFGMTHSLNNLFHYKP